MTRQAKLLTKLFNPNSTLTWDELVSVLKGLGFRQLEGSGNRVKFDNGNAKEAVHLHRLHPGNQIKAYVKRQVVEHLTNSGLI